MYSNNKTPSTMEQAVHTNVVLKANYNLYSNICHKYATSYRDNTKVLIDY